MTGRDRTCDAPRFRRALYRAELRSREWAESASNRRPPPHQRGALPTELSAYEWARLGSNQQPLVCETSALPLSYSPVSNPGQGIEPRSPRSERGVLPVRRSRNVRRSVHPPSREIDAAAHAFRRVVASSDSSSLGRTMFSMPLAYSSTLDRRIAVLRGGALEPDAQQPTEKAHAKANANCTRVIPARD